MEGGPLLSYQGRFDLGLTSYREQEVKTPIVVDSLCAAPGKQGQPCSLEWFVRVTGLAQFGESTVTGSWGHFVVASACPS